MNNMIVNYNNAYNINTVQHVENNTIMSTRSQAQNIPFFYKIVGEQNKKNSNKKRKKNTSDKKNRVRLQKMT